MNNLTNAHPLLSANFEHSTVFDSQDWVFSALRPRTYGLTVTYRNWWFDASDARIDSNTEDAVE